MGDTRKPKSMSWIVALFVVGVIAVIAIGYFLFLYPRSQAAKAARAEITSQPQPGMVVDWKPELPEFVKVEVVLDKAIDTDWKGNLAAWAAHGVFAYKGERAEIGFDPEYAQSIPRPTFTWKVWREDGEMTTGILQFEQSSVYPTAVGQDVFIEEISWVETVRLTE